MEDCPICGNHEALKFQGNERDISKWNCDVCGKYSISGNIESLLRDNKHVYYSQKHLISGLCRKNMNKSRVNIDERFLDSLRNFAEPDLLEAVDLILQYMQMYINDHRIEISSYVPFRITDYPIVFAKNKEKLLHILYSASSKYYFIESNFSYTWDTNRPLEYKLTGNGLKRLKLLKKEFSQRNRQHVVFLIHGIRTHAEWAEKAASILENESNKSLKVRPIRYGYFSLLMFLPPIPFLRQIPVRRITKLLKDELKKDPKPIISVIAHSYGTYIVYKILMNEKKLPKNDNEIQFYRIILCGSIIPEKKL
ncbi:MAG: hypothetical protein L7F78_18200, partial [Syntrophales bacterium LBB04]|nr:hypothetical protein [Syntrophales bacterium LBB04]